jgi:hypothetical protein
MKGSFNIHSIAILLAFLMLQGCFSLRPGSTKTGKKYFETFYVGPEGTQYFIKPLEFESVGSDETLEMDFTYRFRDVVTDTAIVHFSVYGPSIIRSLQSISVLAAGEELTVEGVELMFNETKKDGFRSRFECFMPLSGVEKLFSHPEWTVVVCGDWPCREFEASGKTQKIIPELDQNLFILMR